MRWYALKPTDWLLFSLAATAILSPLLVIPQRGNGTISFVSAYREVRIGMTWEEWEQLQKGHGVQCVCDATDCYVDDLLRSYNVTFRKNGDGALRIWSKRVSIHFPMRPSWGMLHR